MNLKTKQVLSVGLSVLGAGGTLATAILVRESAKKEEETYQTLLPFKKGNRKDILMMYKLPIGVGLFTIGSIIGSTVMSRKAQASIMSMAVLADQGWRKYKHQVKETLGLDKHNDILKNLGNREQLNNKAIIPKLSDDDLRELYYDDLIGYFQATPENMMYAYATINEMLNTHLGEDAQQQFDGVTVDTFLRLADANVVNTNNDEILKEWGWSIDYLAEGFNEVWIHMGLSGEVTDDGIVPYKVISWIEDPILLVNYENNYDEQYAHEETRQLHIEDYAEVVDLNKLEKQSRK